MIYVVGCGDGNIFVDLFLYLVVAWYLLPWGGEHRFSNRVK